MLLDLTDVKVSEKPAAKTFKPGNYLLRVSDAEVKATRNGGKMIRLQMKIVGGEGEWKDFDGWRVSHSFNIENQSPEATRIGKEQLKQFMICAGMTEFALETAKDLIGKAAFAKVVRRTSDGKEFLDVKYFLGDLPNNAKQDDGELFS